MPAPADRAKSREQSTRRDLSRFRDPALTVVLVLQLCLFVVAAPLAAEGLPIARPIVEAMVLATVAIVVVLSRRRTALALIALGLAAVLASAVARPGWPPVATSLLHRGGDIVTFGAFGWVVAGAVYAPGRITSYRLQGAAVLYLNFAAIFASAFCLVWEMNPGAFAGIAATTDDLGELATMLYFSIATLTTTGYGDIAPIDPFARGLANLESLIGVFYIGITVARLVTLELEDRRR